MGLAMADMDAVSGQEGDGRSRLSRMIARLVAALEEDLVSLWRCPWRVGWYLEVQLEWFEAWLG